MSIIEKNMSDSDYQFKKKYLKYKKKYQILKEQQGQGILGCPNWYYFFCFEPDFTGNWIEGSIPKITENDFSTKDKFKKIIINKAYELNSYGVLNSNLGLATYTMTIFNKKTIYEGVIGKILGKSKILTKSVTTYENIDNLNISDKIFIENINSKFLRNITYKEKFLIKALKTGAKSYRDPNPETRDEPIYVGSTRYNQSMKVRKIVSFYGDKLSQILEVHYSPIDKTTGTDKVTEIVPLTDFSRKKLELGKLKDHRDISKIFDYKKIEDPVKGNNVEPDSDSEF